MDLLQFFPKTHMYRVMTMMDIPMPKSFIVLSEGDINHLHAYFGNSDFLFKPYRGSNSEGLFKVNSAFIHDTYKLPIEDFSKLAKEKNISKCEKADIEAFYNLSGVCQEILPIKDEFRVITFRDSSVVYGDIRYGYLSQHLNSKNVEKGREGFKADDIDSMLEGRITKRQRNEMKVIIDKINTYIYENTSVVSLSFDFYITESGDVGLFEFQSGYGTDYPFEIYNGIYKNYNVSFVKTLKKELMKFQMTEMIENADIIINDMIKHYNL